MPPAPVHITAVDLGLPSGTKWANMNVGASEETDNGLYFQWGNTDGVKSGDTFNFNEDQYDETAGAALEADITQGGVNDAAHVELGGDWVIPTQTQLQELVNSEYTTSEWVTNYKGSGVNGLLITSKSNSKSVFFPASGYVDGSSLVSVGIKGLYWSASLDVAKFGRLLEFKSDYISADDSFDRYMGLSVRAVQ